MGSHSHLIRYIKQGMVPLKRLDLRQSVKHIGHFLNCKLDQQSSGYDNSNKNQTFSIANWIAL